MKKREDIKRELDDLYHSKFEWVQAGRILRERYTKSLKENSTLNLLLKLVVLANFGIWLIFILQLI